MPVSVKIGGTWKAATAVFNKVGGVWKTAADMPVKVGGVWKTGILNNSSFESIATFTGNGTSATYTFSSIPSTYKSLQVRITALGSASSSTLIRLNGDTTAANYRSHLLYGAGAGGTGAGTNTGVAGIYLSSVQGLTTNYPTVSIVDLIDYTSASKYKTVRAFSGSNTNTTSSVEISLRSGLYMSTTTITSLTIYTDSGVFNTGTTIALYGIK